ncbi:hypothetical protein PENSUB_8460 [Penicillium subrubescens]|uniref:Uncharacterized protein n=1 Tax=Penicillium subrubescens TaxID=1316194 RepID=A0A1Q5TFS1_9EURO|nr:hypothetical protein PENSUB_8460 [Penicillium subrubescens]
MQIPEDLQPRVLLVHPAALAKHLQTILLSDPSQENLSSINSYILHQVYTEAVSSFVYQVWLFIAYRHSPHLLFGALCDQKSAGVRRAGSKVLRHIFRKKSWKTRGWDPLGGAQGIKTLLDGLPQAQVRWFVKAISPGPGGELFAICIDDLVANIDSSDTWTTRSLSTYMAPLYACCTSKRVTEILRSSILCSGPFYRELGRRHSQLLRQIANGTVEVPPKVRRRILDTCVNALLQSNEAYVPIHATDIPPDIPPGLKFGLDLLSHIRADEPDLWTNQILIRRWTELVVRLAIRRNLPFDSILPIISSSLEMCRVADSSDWLSQYLPVEVIRCWSLARFGASGHQGPFYPTMRRLRASSPSRPSAVNQAAILALIYFEAKDVFSCGADTRVVKPISKLDLRADVQKAHLTLKGLLESLLLLLREPWARNMRSMTSMVPSMLSTIVRQRMVAVRYYLSNELAPESELVETLLDSTLPLIIDFEREGNIQGQAVFSWSGPAGAMGNVECPSSPSRVDLSFMDRLAKARDKLWKDLRARNTPDISTLEPCWPRGLPIQRLVMDSTWLYHALERPEEAPFLSSRLSEILFSPRDIVVAAKTHPLGPIPMFVDDLGYAIRAMVSREADKTKSVTLIWKHYSSILQTQLLHLEIFEDWLVGVLRDGCAVEAINIVRPPSSPRISLISKVPMVPEVTKWNPHQDAEDMELGTGFPEAEGPRYGPTNLSDEFVTRVIKPEGNEVMTKTLVALEGAVQHVPAQILRDLIYSFLDTLKASPNAPNYPKLLHCTFELIKLLLHSSQPQLMTGVALRVWKEFPHDSSSHRKMNLVKIGRILTPDQAGDLMQTFVMDVCDTLQRQREPGDIPAKPFVKITTAKMLVQALAEADFLAPSTQLHLLRSMYGASSHIDVRVEIVKAFFNLIRPNQNDDVFQALSTIALSSAVGPSERHIITEDSWRAAEAGASLPLVSSSRPILDLIISDAATNVPKELHSDYVQKVVLRVVTESIRQHTRWMTVLLARLGLSLSGLGLTAADIGPFPSDLINNVLRKWARYLPATYLQYHHSWGLMYLHRDSFNRISEALASSTDPIKEDANVRDHLQALLRSQRDRCPFDYTYRSCFLMDSKVPNGITDEILLDDFRSRVELFSKCPVAYNHQLGRYSVHPSYTLCILQRLRKARGDLGVHFPSRYSNATKLMMSIVEAAELVRKEGWSPELSTHLVAVPATFEYEVQMLPSPSRSPLPSNSALGDFVSGIIGMISKYAADPVLLIKVDSFAPILREVRQDQREDCALLLGEDFDDGDNRDRLVKVWVRVKLAVLLLETAHRAEVPLNERTLGMIERWKGSDIEMVRQAAWAWDWKGSK